MHNTWFTADTHFEHALLAHKYRPEYATVEEMNEGIITRWNAFVKPGDMVYHLGDFAWYRPEDFVDRLNGRIHLILGNHDSLKLWQKEMFSSVQDVKWLGSKELKTSKGFFLSHYPHRSWKQKEYGSIHLYGHCHGTIPNFGLSMDVGWDVFGRPISLDEISLLMKQRDMKQLEDELSEST